MGEKRSKDYIRRLPDVCAALYPWAVNWRNGIYQENRDEIGALDEFICICERLDLIGQHDKQKSAEQGQTDDG